MLRCLKSVISIFVKICLLTYIHLHIATSNTFSKLHQDISIQIQLSMSIFFIPDRSTPYLINTSTYDKLRTLLYIYVFPSNCRCIYMHITNYMKTNMTTSKLMSGDTSIHRKQITSYYINRDTYTNVVLVEYRLFHLC